jgi:hypothetical protein
MKTTDRLTILVSSTVYGVEELLDRVYVVLTQYGYRRTERDRKGRNRT